MVQNQIKMVQKESQQKTWRDFYESRVNSDYQKYFEERYGYFLDYIKLQMNNYDEVVEIGCGIGSISKALMKEGIKCSGFDKSQDMVNLSIVNNEGKDIFYKDNLFKHEVKKNVLYVSHGVLEHYNNGKIQFITNKYKNSIHYVPLDKYDHPSYGDQRLIPYEEWVNITNPFAYFLFNNRHDFAFYMKDFSKEKIILNEKITKKDFQFLIESRK